MQTANLDRTEPVWSINVQSVTSINSGSLISVTGESAMDRGAGGNENGLINGRGDDYTTTLGGVVV